MQNTGGGEVRRIFVKVFGFSDVERHALNTVFRLSGARAVVYAPWAEDAPEKAKVALVDGDSWEATIDLANPGNDKLRIIWVGQRPSSAAALVFERPLQWAAIIEGLDSFYAPAMTARPAEPMPLPHQPLDFDVSAPVSLDIDFDLGLEHIPDDHASDADTTTEPAPLDGVAPGVQGERVLVVGADLAARLYIRAKLANAGLMLIDEAVTGAEALAFMDSQAYVLAMIDLGVADMDGWKLARQAAKMLRGRGHVVVMRDKFSLLDKWRTHFAGVKVALAKPLDPRELKRLLADIGCPQRK